MNRLTRDLFIERTQGLLVQRGGFDVSLSTVLNACGASKGSLYHFFPSGKDELLIAAMEKQSECAVSSNRSILSESKSTGQAVARLAKSLVSMLESDNCPDFMPFSAAGAVTGQASEQLREICAKALNSLQTLYFQSLRSEGVPTRLAKSLSSLVVSTIEGALLHSRTQESTLPLKNAGIHLRELIDSHTVDHEG
ncbi:MAG: TetR/AcrR family transcriptional regulator [Planctomycetota bacterium]